MISRSLAGIKVIAIEARLDPLDPIVLVKKSRFSPTLSIIISSILMMDCSVVSTGVPRGAWTLIFMEFVPLDGH